jgi:uncharacterized protein YecE (DUF72 family)
MSILVGTASWTDKSLIESGKFYPATVTTPEARLKHYAQQFPIVEVDSSYYAIPAPETAQLWAERSPPGFVFNVKAFRLFTGHQTQPRVLPRDIQQALGVPALQNIYYRDVPEEIRRELWSRFFQALAPLHAAGKLGALHFQFAPWITSGGEARKHVEHCASMTEGFVVAVEFRNVSWWTDRTRESTLAFERAHALVNVVVDGPQGFSSSVPPIWEVTHPRLAIVRMHGRNAATWEKKGLRASSDRFNYDYSEQELDGLAENIEARARRVPTVHAILNNNYQDQGQRNAQTLRRLISAHGGAAPMLPLADRLAD